MVTEATLKSAMKKNGYRRALIDEDMFDRCVEFLSTRYARYISGTECTNCWGIKDGTLRCYCGLHSVYTNLERMAYKFRPVWESE